MTEVNHGADLQHYQQHGWCKFAFDDELYRWVEHVLPAAANCLTAKENEHWWRYQDTWFVGVNALPNDASGAVDGGPRFSGTAQRFMQQLGLSTNQMDRAQISTCFPGYPKAASDESQALHSYRLNRDAAHVDGLLKEGPERNRFAREHHEYILLIPLTEVDVGAAPVVVWNESHLIMKEALIAAFDDIAREQWTTTAVTEPYQVARKKVFEQCQRLELNVKPGEAVLAHRLLLHGTSPWQSHAKAGKHGRMLCFFRPQNLTMEQWLHN